jgi:WhiB family redox-sensing transcriptional regulator
MWHLRASCRGMDPDLFFPTSNDGHGELRRLCAACPSRTDCLDHAIEHVEPGWWGGMSEHERRRLKARRIRAARDAEMGIGRRFEVVG